MNKNHVQVNKNPAILFAVLNMGLGHASRSLPILKDFLNRNYHLTIASSGRSLTFLQQELPAAEFIVLPDYRFEYGQKGVNLAGVLRKIPVLFNIVSQENRIVTQLLRVKKFNVIMSDHRYGCFNTKVPSFFISHQLRFIAPAGLRFLEFLGIWFNRYFHRKFTQILIPDEFDGKAGYLSGRMSSISPASRLNYCGILSSLSRQPITEDIDVLFSISGPEPQRTVFEQLARNILPKIPGNKVLALGKPESNQIENPSSDLVIYHHPSRQQMENLFNRSRLIISRSGYSTIMELVELQKKAVLIPTPGQTEQVYLAKRLQDMGWFHWFSQSDDNIEKKLLMNYYSKKIDQNFSTQSTLIRINRLLDTIL
ncbi:MAG: hypothetical protein JSW33_07730 [bacterium]|nr:MAG: hypothetical protein JSW33_07730 [bacterium]